jgi:hypothetical protein
MSTVPASRLGRLLGYDGVIATLLLGAFRFFLVSLSFVACLTPALAFQALVGWQATHLALWLGSASLLTVAPALRALAVSAAVLLDGGPAPARAFWRGFADAVRAGRGASLLLSAAALVLGYDVALLGASGPVLLGAAAIAAIVVAVVLAAAFLADSPLRGVGLLVAAARIVALRPHLALVWLLLAALAILAATLPVVGAVAWLSAPALAAVAAVVCNRALGFEKARERVGA